MRGGGTERAIVSEQVKVGRAGATTANQAAALCFAFFFLCTKQPAAAPEAARRRLKFVCQTALAQPLLRGHPRRRQSQHEGAEAAPSLPSPRSPPLSSPVLKCTLKGTPTHHCSADKSVEAGFSSPALGYFHSEGFISKRGLSVTMETVSGQDASADEVQRRNSTTLEREEIISQKLEQNNENNH